MGVVPTARNVTLTRLGVAGLAVVVASVVGWASVAAARPAAPKDELPSFGPGARYHPVIEPSAFTPNVDNPWFPLKPGTTLVYSGTKDGKAAFDLFAPSAKTKVVDGVTTRVVEDRLFLDGILEERTSDYYAQDDAGNVWYFGEDTAELDSHGRVKSTEGSFHAGVEGAEPGVFMQSAPETGRRFRQEWSKGHAEDQFKAVDRSASISVPYRASRNALRTEETTALEPGVLDNKYYVRGVGEVEEVAVKGPREKLRLVGALTTR